MQLSFTCNNVDENSKKFKNNSAFFWNGNKKILVHCLILGLFAIIQCAPALAQWSSNPAVNNAISTAIDQQHDPKIVSDGAGGAIITWYDYRNGNADIYAQRINAGGAVQWAADGVAICTAANIQLVPTIVSDGAGGAIITWQDFRSGSNYNIYAQRINEGGVVQWTTDGVAICNATSDQLTPTIVSDGAGGAIITWRDLRSGSNYDIYAQRINAGGAVQWAADGVAICNAPNNQVVPTTVSDGAGGAIITWQDLRSGNRDIYAQRVNAGGAAQWAADGIAICTATGDQVVPTIVSDGAGGAIITWFDFRSGSNYDIYAQRINGGGAAQWAADGIAICTATGNQEAPTIVSDGAGGAIITWYDYRNGNADIYTQRINAGGAVQWAADGIVICTATSNQVAPTIVSDLALGAIITWHDDRGSSSDIYAQRIDAAGAVQWAADGVAICTATGNQFVPMVVSDGAGGAIIAWYDYRIGNSDIYAQRVNATGILGCSSGEWLGLTNDWFTASNWCNGIIPTATTDVIIPASAPNQPVIGGAGAVCKNIIIDNGASLTISGSNTLSINGNWTNNGTFNANSSTVSFTANTAVTQTLAGNTTFYNISKPNINSTLSFGSTTTTIGNNLSIGAGSMAGGTSVIIFTGAASSLQGNSNKNFYDLQINNGAGITHSAANMTIAHDLINNGTLGFSGSRTATFNGGGTHTISGSGSTTFNNLTIAASNTVDAGSHSINIKADWTNNGTFLSSSDVTFNGSTAQAVSGSSTTNFTALLVNKTSGDLTLNSPTTVSNDLGLISGTFVSNDKLTLNDGVTIYRADGSLTGTPVFGATASLYYANGSPVTTGAEIPGPGTIVGFTASANNITLDNPVIISTLSLGGSSKIFLGDHNITTNFISNSPYAYVVTNGMGTITVKNITGPVFFPVGPSASLYNPIVISNGGGADFSVNVKTSLTNAPVDPLKVVNTQWDISKTGSQTGNNVTLTPHWSTGNEAGNFVRTNSLVLGHYGGSGWEEISAGAVSGPDANGLYAATINGVSSFSPFAVGNENAFVLACIPPSISGGGQPMPTQSICQNGTATNLSVTATGDGLTYQWFRDDDGAGNDETTLVASTQTFTPPTNVAGTFKYFCKVMGTCGTVYSNYAEVIVNAALVHNTTTNTDYCTIQAAIDAASTGDVITIDPGTFDEQVLVNKSVTIKGVGLTQPIVNFTGTPIGKPTLFDISADGVIIENIHFNVDLSKLRSAIIVSGAGIDNITVKDNVIDAYGVPAGGYGDRNAVSINYGGTTNYRVATGGIDNVIFQGNTVNGLAPSSYFRSGISLDEGGGTFSGNTLQTINHDVLVRFASNGAVTISNNNFNGGGVELADQNAAAGIITVSNNTFTGAGAPNTVMLRIKNNYNSIVHIITGNSFSNYEWAVSSENMNSITFNGNTFATSSTTATAVVINTKSLSSNSNTIVQVPVGATFTNNNFNGSGNALSFLNHDSDNDSYGTFTLGSVGNENNFASSLTNFILFDSQTGSSNGSTFPVYLSTGGWPTTMACWDQNINAVNNKFDVGAGLQLPSAMNLTGRTTLEGKLFHKPDAGCLGIITYFYPVHNVTQNTYYTTIQSAINAANTNDVIECAEYIYNEKITIDKTLTLTGASEANCIIDGTGLGNGSGITINNGVTGVKISYFTIRNHAGTSPNAFAGIYAIGSNNGLEVKHCTIKDNIGGSGFYANGPVNGVTLDDLDISGHSNAFGAARGIVIWNGLKENITIINSDVYNNNCCGIELQDGTATGVTMLNNNVHNNGDNGIGLVGLQGPAANLIQQNTVTNNGRFGIEIKNANGSGANSGAGSVVINNNTVSRTNPIGGELRDLGGIVVIRRVVLPGNVDVPTGVYVSNNSVSGFIQPSASEGFGIVAEGINHTITGNTVNGNDIGIQRQAGHTPYPGDGDQSNLADTYFGRGNSPVSCGITLSGNILSNVTANGIDTRDVGNSASTGIVTNINTGESFCSIQAAIDDPQTLNGHTISASVGLYNEDVTVTKELTIKGAGIGLSTVSGPIGGNGSTFQVSAANVIIEGFTITRDGNNTTDWNNAGLNTAGIAVQGQTSFAEIRYCELTGLRTGIDINNSNGNNIHNNNIHFNRTGMIFRNQTDNTIVSNNFIKDNWTLGILFLDASGGTNTPVQSAANSTFSNNDISGNWYGQIADRQSGGSIPAPGTNLKNFTCNWYGTTSPVLSIANSTEPGYAAQIPVAYGGGAIPPGGQPSILGPASANFTYVPYLSDGTDLGGNANDGFQPTVPCQPCAISVTATSTDATCPALNNGTATANVTGAVGTVTYSWNTSPVQTTQTATGLVAGTYTVAVTDINGCVATANVTVINNAVYTVHNLNTGLNYCTIQAAINDPLTLNGHTITVDAGTYNEDVLVNKSLTITGADKTTTIIKGINGGDNATIRIAANNIELSNFTITRNGNTVADWNDPNLNSAGIAVIGTSLTGMNIHDNIITGNRSAIDINNSNGHSIHNNVIDNNHTGVIFRNQTDNISFTENEVTNNRTVGILFLDASGGTNSPVQTALNGTFFNNNISGNWYGQIVDRQSGGSLPAPGTTNLKNFSGNWYGTATPVVTTVNSAEPAYSALIPTVFGGSATAPGGQPDIAGPASANFDYTPWLMAGTDISGTFGFQGDFSNLTVTTAGGQTGSTQRVQEGINLVTTGGTVNILNGTYDEDIDINKDITVDGQSTAAIIRGLYAGSANTVLISASNATLRDVTVTRNYGSTVADWYASTKNQGINVAQGTTGVEMIGLVVKDNRNGIFVNNAQNVAISGSIIENNRTGLHFGNNFSGAEVHNNFIRNNFTHGVLFNYDLANGVTAANVHITNNSITGNWYAQVNLQDNTNTYAPGNHSGLDFSCNWYGAGYVTAVAAPAGEPGYGVQLPSQFGGADPGLNRFLYGNKIALAPYQPWLTIGTDNDANEATGFQPAPGNCNGVNATTFYVNDNSTTSDVYTTAIGNDANPGTASAPFRTITKALSVASSGNTIYVDAGNYTENTVVDKSLTILGPNATISGCDSRVAEAIIRPSTSQPFYDGTTEVRMMQIEANNVTIKGFTFDGDNPLLTTHVIDAADGIDVYADVQGIVIENNIFKNINEGAVNGYPSGTTSLTNNKVSNNKFENIPGNSDPGYPFSGYGIGVLIYNDFYANVDNNCMENVRIGVQTGNYHLANSGTPATINNNTISSNSVGIFHNLHYQNASPFTVNSNQVSANDPGNTGMLLWSFQGAATTTVTDNTFTGGSVGIEAWNNPTSNTISVNGGSITGARVGILATNYSSYGDAASSELNITGVTISNCDTAMWVNDHNSNTNSSTVRLNINSSTNNVNGIGLGLLLQGGDASVNFGSGTPINFSSSLSKYIRLATNGTNVPSANINAQHVQFGGQIGSAMSLNDLFATEDKIDHKIDWNSLGFVSVKANHDFVTTNSFYPGQTTTALVQRGVDASSSGWTVNVGPGTFTDQVEVNSKDITILGQGAGVSTILSPNVLPITFTTSGVNKPIIYVHDAANVIIKGVTVDGAGKGNANNRFEGIAYRNAGGTVEEVEIKGIRNNPIDGVQHGVGIFAFADNGTARTLNVINNTIYDFQKNGTVFSGNNLTVNATGNTITGAGAVSYIAQNGIQLSSAATGNIINNIISGFSYEPATYASAGILVDGASGTVNVTGNKVNNAQVGIWLYNSNGNIESNEVAYVPASMGATPYWYGIVVNKGTATVKQNTVNGGGNGAGIEADAYSGETTIMNAINNIVDNTDEGFVIYPDGTGVVTATIHYNSITNSITKAIHNYGTVDQDATCNWYGTTNAGDIANLIQGPVTYAPYLSGGTDADISTPGFQTNEVCAACTLSIQSITGENLKCKGDNSGTATVNVTGAVNPSYLWSPGGQTTATITGLAAGTYSVTITDFNGCTATGNVTITEPDAPLVASSSVSYAASGPVVSTSLVSPANYTFGSGGVIPGDPGGRTWMFSNFNDAPYAGLWWTFNPVANPKHSSQGAIGNMQFSSYNAATGIATFVSTSPMIWTTALGTQTINTRMRIQFQPYTGTHSGPIASGWIDPTTAGTIGLGTLPAAWPLIDIKALPGDNRFQVWFAVEEVSTGNPLNVFYNSSNSLGGSVSTSISGNFFSAPPSECGSNPSVTVSATGGTGPYNGTGTFPAIPGLQTYTVTDANGCTATTTISVAYSSDNTPPAIPTLPTLTGECSVTVPVATTTDNCAGTVNGTTSDPLTYTAQGTYTVHWTFTDGNGNTSTANQTVIVKDVTPPSITCPAPVVVSNTTGECGANVTFSAMANDNCDGVVVTYSPASGSFFNVGTTEVTATATDIAGNQTTCKFNVTVNDTEKPVTLCKNVQVALSASGTASITAADINNNSTDNCGIASVVASKTSFDCSDIGANAVTLTVTDIHGNFSTCVATVTVVDEIKPTLLSCPVNITENAIPSICGRVVTYSLPTFTDNCGGATIAQTDGTGLTSGQIFPAGVTVQEFTITDASGNKVVCSFTVTIADNQEPIITGCPSDIIVDAAIGQCSAKVNWAPPIPSDNCPGVTFVPSHLPGSYFPVGTTIVTYTATDVSGNTATCSFKIIVKDAQLPVINCPSNIIKSNDAGQCGAYVTYNATASDNCPGVSVTYSHASGSFFPVGITEVTATATDASGNTSECKFTITVNDTQLPSIACPSNILVNNDAGQCGAVVNFTAPVGTDNCTGAITTQIAGLASGSLFPVGVTTNTYEVKDASGNISTCSFTITVKDAEIPTIECPSNINVGNDEGQCGAIVNFSVNASDNCPGVTVSYSHQPGSFFPIGTTTVTATATDAAGKKAMCSFTVTVTGSGQGGPVMVTCKPDVIVSTSPGNCTANVQLEQPEVTGGCGSISISNNHPSPVYPLGITIVTWTVTDGNGGTTTCIQKVIVQDNVAPVINCPSNIITTISNNSCSKIVSTSKPTFNDNCSVAKLTWVMSGATTGNSSSSGINYIGSKTFNAGITTIAYTVTDNAGNTTSCSYTVTVKETKAPSIKCPKDITVSADPVTCTGANVNLGSPTVSDNCGVTTVTNNAPETFPVGVTYVKWTATDKSGNTSHCTQKVTVTGAIPTISCPANVSVVADAGCYATNVNLGTPVTTGCGTLTVTNNAPSQFPVGVTNVEWKVKDAAGNTRTCIQKVTVTGGSAPLTIICPADKVVSANYGKCYATNISLGTPATTGCGSLTITNNAPSQFPVGVTYVEWKVKDAGGNIQTCTQKVTVTGGASLTISCPSDKTVSASYGKCYATNVNLGTPTTTGCGNLTITNDAPSQFPIGTTIVTWKVADNNGNEKTCTQKVKVTGSVSLTINCPYNKTVYTDEGKCYATNVNLGTPTTTGCGTLTVTNNAPTHFPIGTTDVRWTVRDAGGNTATCIQKVTVREKQDPVIVCPSDLYYCKSWNNNYTVPAITATDNCSGISNIQYSVTGATNRNGYGTNASGIFYKGVSYIKWTVKDASGNTSYCTVKVTVQNGNCYYKGEPDAITLDATAYPNPTENYFSLKVISSNTNTPVEIRIFDMNGKVLQVLKGAAGQTFRFGDRFTTGVYMVEVRQGKQTVTKRIVKQ